MPKRQLDTASEAASTERVVAAAVEEVMRYVDPVVCAVATEAWDRAASEKDAEGIIAKSISNVVGSERARAIGAAAARLRLSGLPVDEEEEEAVVLPAWARTTDPDEALVAFSEWCGPDPCERAAARHVVDLIGQLFQGAELYGSRTGPTSLFDSDVDVAVPSSAPLKVIAATLDDCEWTRDVDLVQARVPIVTGEHQASGLTFDVSRQRDDDDDDLRADWQFTGPVARFCKLLFRQHGLDRVYDGGIGSHRIYVAIACFVTSTTPPSTPHAALVGFLRFLARAALHPPAGLDLDHLHSPTALARVARDAADAIENATLARAFADLHDLVAARARHARRARRFHQTPKPPPVRRICHGGSRLDALLGRQSQQPSPSTLHRVSVL